MSHEDYEDSIRESVVPYFSRGLLMLEDFVEELDKTPHDISVTAAQRIMPYLLGLVAKAYKAFQNAESTIDEINTKMDNDLQDIVVQEKTTNDQLRQTQEDLTKLEEKEKVLQGECSELEQQLSKEEINLRKDNESLNERKTKLEEKKKKEMVVNIVTWAAVPLFGVAGVAAKMLVDDVLEKEVANAEEAVKEATTHLERTKERFGRKKRELSNLTNAKEETKKKHTTKSQELKMLEQRKAEIKKSQKRLGTLNESIKSCTMLVGTTTTRAKMMADEANDELPDIEAMIVPLRAIAGDLSEASLPDSRLLSGNVNMKRIGKKIQMITSTAMKAITPGDVDQWA